MPSRTEYDEAILLPRLRLVPAHLKAGNVEVVWMGRKNWPGQSYELPKCRCGAFAVVYEFSVGPQEKKAIRCFFSPVPERMRERYVRLSDLLKQKASGFTVGFHYHDPGIITVSSSGKKRSWPIVEMDYVDGDTLLERLYQLCKRKDKASLSDLAEKWVQLVLAMKTVGMAHGNLSGNDVMIDQNGLLVLIDYDSVYFADPVLIRNPPRESGAPEYQHPEHRTHRPYDERMDDFSALAIYVAMLALCEDPMLFLEYVDVDENKGHLLGDNLLFGASDYEDPDRSELFQRAEGLQSPELTRLVKVLERACKKPIAQVPTFECLVEQNLNPFPHVRGENMSYSQPWNTTTPGCVILLLDHSSSMSDKIGGGRDWAGRELQVAVATVLNNFINELGRRCLHGDELRKRVYVAVIGYGGSYVGTALAGNLAAKELVCIDELMDNPLRIDPRTKKEVDDTGQMVEYSVEFPIWLEPHADGGTPMCQGLRKAREIAQSFVAKHPDSFPPMVINLTDGASTDGDPRPDAEQLRNLESDDGKLLLFNCHLSASAGDDVYYPGPDDALPQDPYAPILFEMSSELPDAMLALARELVHSKSDFKAGNRGFVFNADVSGVVTMITIVSTPQMSPQAAGAQAETGSEYSGGDRDR